jgi:hypothetical protein
MSWVAVAVVGGAVVGGYMTSQASQGAANTQAAAADRATATQYDIYQQQRKDYEPWKDAGVKALNTLQDPSFGKNLEMEPGYAFRMSEGMKAINNAAAARGMGNSGATMKALTRFGQDYGSNEYGKAYDRAFGRATTLAGFGNQANTNTANAGANYAQQAGQNLMGAANAQSASQIATANAYGNAINTGTNAWLMSNLMKKG